MNATLFSLIAAIIWCNIYIGAIAIIWKHKNLNIRVATAPLIALIVASTIRLLYFSELPYTVIVPSKTIVPFFYNFLIVPKLTISALNVTMHLEDVLVIVWGIGSCYLLQKYVRDLVHINRIIHNMPKTQDTQVLACMREVMKDHHRSSDVSIIKSPHITIPMVTGYFKPTIYLPDLRFSDADLKNILSHELAHFLHKDAWFKLFVHVVSLVFWWNPLTHLLRADLDHLLEIQCDLRITKQMDAESRKEYLSSITKILRSKNLSPTPYIPTLAVNVSMLASTSNKDKIKQRFQLVLQYSEQQRHRLASALICTCIFISFLFSYSFIVQPVYPLPVEDEGFELFSITPGGAYLQANQDGTYSVYAEGEFRFMISKEDIIKEPYSLLSIQ